LFGYKLLSILSLSLAFLFRISATFRVKDFASPRYKRGSLTLQGTWLSIEKRRQAQHLLEYERGEIMSVTILPTFKGYTVDMRLREFRRAIPDVTLEFIPFNSPEGEKLLVELKSFAQEILALGIDE